MQRLNFKLIFLLSISMIYSSIGSFAAPMEDSLRLARNFYQNQDYQNALRYYEQYLVNNYTVSFGDIVIEAALTRQGVDTQIQFIQKYLDKAPRLYDKMVMHKHIAFLYEVLWDYSSAIIHYSLAYQASRPLNYELYLRVAKLSFEVGEYARALYIARSVALELRNDPRLYNEVLIIMLRSVLMLPDAWDNFEKIMQVEKLFIDDHARANLLYLLYLAYARHQNFMRSQEFKARLIRRYPQSPEAMELQGKIKRSITPSLIWW